MVQPAFLFLQEFLVHIWLSLITKTTLRGLDDSQPHACHPRSAVASAATSDALSVMGQIYHSSGFVAAPTCRRHASRSGAIDDVFPDQGAATALPDHAVATAPSDRKSSHAHPGGTIPRPQDLRHSHALGELPPVLKS
jgi:hypothetical protein